MEERKWKKEIEKGIKERERKKKKERKRKRKKEKERESMENGKGRKDERRKDEFCKEKGDLCERAQCVATKWFKNRKTASNQPQTWCTFWGNNDVGKLLKELSGAMTNADTGDHDLCKSIVQEKGDSPYMEANRKACEYIVKGLEHTYKIKEYGTWSGKDTDKKKKENQQFGQTMSCVLLNIYADLLKKKSQEQKCNVEENIIKQAFEKGKGQMDKWCKDKGNCIECKRQEIFDCKLDVDSGLWDAQGSKDCLAGKDDVENKVTEMLNEDTKVQRTLKSICKRNFFFSKLPPYHLTTTNLRRDCSSKNKLCDRLECIAHNWFEDRINTAEVKKTWCEFWNPDVKKRLKEISKKMVTGSATMDSLCERTVGKTTTLNAAGKKACGFITAGLKYIYGIKENADVANRKKARNNRLTEQTLYCLFLNEYANLLIEKTKGQVCPILEENIKEMFEKGNAKMDEWCLEGKKSGNDCVKCERDTSYKTCPLSVDSSLWTTTKSTGGPCDKDGTNVKGEVDGLLDTNQNKDQEVKQAVNAINTINKNNTLCDRVKCIYYRWGENRKDNGEPPWPQFWNPDVETRLKNLSEAITKKNGTYESLCENIQDGKSGPASEASKKACNFIVNGLKHIYNIQKGQDGSTQKKEDNQIFHRTFSCILLNALADEMEKKCSAIQDDIKEGINHAFQKSKDIKEQTHACNNEGDMCPVCERDKDYSSCRIQKSDGNTIKKRFDDMLNPNKNKDPKVKEVLEEIEKICPTRRELSRSETGNGAIPPRLPEPVPAPKEATDNEPKQTQAGKSAHPSKGTSRKVNCSGQIADAGANLDACFDDVNDLSIEPPVSILNEHHEATGKTGPLGELGTKPGTTTVTEIVSITNSGPGLTPTHADSQTPSTGTDTQTPSGSAAGTSTISTSAGKNTKNENKRKKGRVYIKKKRRKKRKEKIK
ncbi:SICA antigen [Plasmodium coatneyi]|uniref:SICA antigen n=1 Tax=Plasmodium coatneyi TaxID=208452 RepID=A0A1B1DYJ6_9APIC|nr:SICA antigen [Plasmodium coatneyi]ANQ07657.1 SICA antigen [Plasmodium coatneyi]